MVAINSGYTADAPPKMATALILKLVGLEKELMSSDSELTIHVVGSPAMAATFHKVLGLSIGKYKVSMVTASDDLPSEKPSVLCLSDTTKLSETIEYTRREKVLSVTNIPELVAKGISLGVGVGDNGKPEILLNMSSSVKEGLDWDPAILKIIK